MAINNCNSVSSVVETIVVGVARLSISSDSRLKRFIGTFGGCVPIVDSAEEPEVDDSISTAVDSGTGTYRTDHERF